MASECVVDTMILQKANAPLVHSAREGRLFERRIKLLLRIADGTVRPMVSVKLVQEYARQVQSPRNEYIRAFFELLDHRDRVTWHWAKRWSGGLRAAARQCRYPLEDDHLLRTAACDRETAILTEEDRLLKADACIYRSFRVHVRYLP